MQFPPVIAAAIEAGDTVITSSARAARALRRLHGEMQRKRGLAAWQSADILDWDSWLNRLWQKKLRSGSETRLLLTRLQEQQVWARLVKPSIEGRRLISAHSVSELAQQAYALLCEYGALDFLRGEIATGPDVESFRQWAQDFELLCRKEDWLTRGRLPLALHDAVLAGQFEATPRLVLAGFDRITPAQDRLFQAFRDQCCSVEMAEGTEDPTPNSSLLVKAVDKPDEIRTCALWVQRELAAAAMQGQTARIAVVVPSVSSVRPEIERIFRQVLAPQAVVISTRDLPLDFEFSLGVPLGDVPMARAALLLLRWMNHALPQDEASWLMLSGFLSEQPDELLPIASFDARLRRQPMRQPEQDLDTYLQFLSEGWREAAPLDKLRHRLRSGRRMLNMVKEDGLLTFAEWVSAAQRILDAAGWPGAHPMQSEDFQVEARWSQLLDSIAALAFDGRRVGYAEFLTVLERQAGQTIFAPESRDAAVQILGPLEAAGLTFDALWFLGADDLSWPAVARPQPFLSRSLQRQHRMPHADSAADWKLAQQVTTRLERSASKCVFSYAAQSVEGASRPSTLVSSARPVVAAKDLRISLGADEALGTGQDPTLLLTEEEPAAVVPWPIEVNAGGAEVLRRQAACPFQSFATKRLAAKPMDATDWGLEARERGSVVHKILEDIWTELKSRDGLVEAEAHLPGIVERHVQAALSKYGNQLHARTQSWSQAYLQAEHERIVSLIEEWLAYEKKRAPFIVEANEDKRPAVVGSLQLQVRVDRIDAVDGGRVIIDYKTGIVKANAWEGARPDEPQLPLYAGYGQVADVTGVLLGRVRTNEVKFMGRVEDSNAVMPGDARLAKTAYTEEMVSRWKSVLLDLAQQFLNGEAQVDPKSYPKTCEFCDLPGLCRIAESDRANTDVDDESDGDPFD
jgi:ATP-dependent helicase/nuclease subunit B